MKVMVEVPVEGVHPLELNFEDMRWTAERTFDESDFPLVTFLNAKRYEIYSNGTFAEVEL
jgi:hypothetical protein